MSRKPACIEQSMAMISAPGAAGHFTRHGLSGLVLSLT